MDEVREDKSQESQVIRLTPEEADALARLTGIVNCQLTGMSEKMARDLWAEEPSKPAKEGGGVFRLDDAGKVVAAILRSAAYRGTSKSIGHLAEVLDDERAFGAMTVSQMQEIESVSDDVANELDTLVNHTFLKRSPTIGQVARAMMDAVEYANQRAFAEADEAEKQTASNRAKACIQGAIDSIKEVYGYVPYNPDAENDGLMEIVEILTQLQLRTKDQNLVRWIQDMGDFSAVETLTPD